MLGRQGRKLVCQALALSDRGHVAPASSESRVTPSLPLPSPLPPGPRGFPLSISCASVCPSPGSGQRKSPTIHMLILEPSSLGLPLGCVIHQLSVPEPVSCLSDMRMASPAQGPCSAVGVSTGLWSCILGLPGHVSQPLFVPQFSHPQDGNKSCLVESVGAVSEVTYL